MCPPTYFDVRYAINPWMDPAVGVDRELAERQWLGLVQVYQHLGHRVELIEPLAELPDMVFAANGALVVGDRALGSRYLLPERAAEAPAHAARLAEFGIEVVTARAVSEGEGDFLVVGPTILAGFGFRTSQAAHREAEAVLGREVVSLRLVDAHYYHLDVALTVLDEQSVAYYPPAFAPESVAELQRRFPDAIIVGECDASVLGLNAVSDGVHVVLAAQATAFAVQLRERGFAPIPVDLSEFRKAGGGVKCCTMELHPAENIWNLARPIDTTSE